MELLLSKSSMAIVKYVAWILGWLMNGIYVVLDQIGIANIGLCIIFFTIIMYILMTPLQIKQQKSSKVMAAIQPELKKVQAKYEGKKDQASQQKMQEETMALYSKYGTSPTGSCLTLGIQPPILFALYQVILYIPGYITRVGNMFNGLATQITGVNGYAETLATFVTDNKVRLYGKGDYTVDRVIDLLYILKPSQWEKLQTIFPELKADIVSTAASSSKISTFFGINITETPLDSIISGFKSIVSGNATGITVLALIVGILIPILAWFTQWLNMKLMPQSANQADDQMSRQMNQMNAIMPIFSGVMCLSFNMGIGIYWIIGAIVRGVQQVIINRHIGAIDMEEMAQKAEEKNAKKREKDKDYVANITQNARTNVKKIQNEKSAGRDIDSAQFYKDASTLNPSSITAKANWVKAFDDTAAAKKKGSKASAEAENTEE